LGIHANPLAYLRASQIDGNPDRNLARSLLKHRQDGIRRSLCLQTLDPVDIITL
jgi:hypothetical protein